jgi:LysM repeat protein
MTKHAVVKAICAVLIISLGVAWPPLVQVHAQSTTNLLENPGFEGDYEVRCSFPGGKPWIAVPCEGPIPSRPWQSVMMADGWSAWWQPPSEDPDAKDFYTTYPNYCGQLAPDNCVAWHMPEYKDTRSGLQDPPRIRSGENSQKYFTFWSVHEGGVYQVVENVRPGMPLRFSIYMHAWSATKLHGLEPNPHFSFGQTGMHMKIGIDPTGGTDPWSEDVIWSAEKDVYDKFERYEVQAVARANKVTVFTHSRPENPMEHNDIYLDDAELVASGGGGGFSAPVTVNPAPAMVAVESKPAASNGGRISHIVKPGDTLFALALQYGVPVDQIMALNGLKPDSRIELGRELIIALPEAKPQAPAQPAAGGSPFLSSGSTGSGRGSICLRTFTDGDANGLYLSGEVPLAVAGLRVRVLNAQDEVVGDRTLDAASGETCFTDLPATTYRVLADLPIGYLVTQQNRWSISLPSDALVAVPFGVQIDPTAQNRFPIEQAAILIGLLIGVGALIGLAIWLRRRRRYAWM